MNRQEVKVTTYIKSKYLTEKPCEDLEKFLRQCNNLSNIYFNFTGLVLTPLIDSLLLKFYGEPCIDRIITDDDGPFMETLRYNIKVHKEKIKERTAILLSKIKDGTLEEVIQEVAALPRNSKIRIYKMYTELYSTYAKKEYVKILLITNLRPDIEIIKGSEEIKIEEVIETITGTVNCWTALQHKGSDDEKKVLKFFNSVFAGSITEYESDGFLKLRSALNGEY